MGAEICESNPRPICLARVKRAGTLLRRGGNRSDPEVSDELAVIPIDVCGAFKEVERHPEADFTRLLEVDGNVWW